MKKRIKTAIGILMMLTTITISDKVYVFFVYILAASLHEFGHLFIAKALRIKIKRIFFDFSGVRIAVDSNITSYRSEILLALAGPAVNILLATLTSYIVLRDRSTEEVITATEKFLSTGNPTIKGIYGFFIAASCIQAIINLLPIKSFDGGRILYCVVSLIINERIADKTLSLTSGVFAFLLWTISLYLMLRISAGLGIFVFSVSIFMLMLTNPD